MRWRAFPVFEFVLAVFVAAQGVRAADPAALSPATTRAASSTIERALAWLQPRQNPDGSWSDPEHPALTALVVSAFLGAPAAQYRTPRPEFVRQGLEFLLRAQKPDGGIYRTGLANYNTAIAMVALAAAQEPAYDEALRRARHFVVKQQNDFGRIGVADDALDGGIGYGDSRKHADLSNTLFALEALRHTRDLVRDKEMADLNWPAVIGFLERCQNLPSHNTQAWVNADANNLGGFVYLPGHSMAGETNVASGRKALRSYGSMSYAGLLSYLYADLKRDDPRVRAVIDWITHNYTLDENPGLGDQGLYYYYHTLAKALSAYGAGTLRVAGRPPVLWREALAVKIIGLQQRAGYWQNANNRWRENDRVLATAYAVLALEYVTRTRMNAKE